VIYNIQKYIFYTALHVRGMGSNPVGYNVYFLLSYLERKPTEPSHGFVNIS